jgi:hypothetical protein
LAGGIIRLAGKLYTASLWDNKLNKKIKGDVTDEKVYRPVHVTGCSFYGVCLFQRPGAHVLPLYHLRRHHGCCEQSAQSWLLLF